MLAEPAYLVFVDRLPADRPRILGRAVQAILWSGDDVHFVPLPQSW